MKSIFALTIVILGICTLANAVEFEKYADWKNRPQEKFTDPEANFKLAMDKILQEYLDAGISKEDLYRAATAGMLETLNTEAHTWNTLLTPGEVSELQSDLSGKISGIGIGLKFDDKTGYAQILNVLPHSPSSKAGLRRDDQILSVDGKRYKGRQFRDIVAAIRGKIGESITLKILREDKVISVRVKREVIPWTPVELVKVDSATQLLTIGYFTNDTPKLVEEKLTAVNGSGATSLIVDLRDNSGGGFENAVQTAELFVPKNKIITSTKGRDGKTHVYKSSRGLLKGNINVILLTNGATSSGAELFAGSLRDELGAKIVGESTLGKWNVQTIQVLSNGFAIKYSVMGFQTPSGKSYQGIGLKPEVEVALPKDVDAKELRVKFDVLKRLELDTQLKAATELVKARSPSPKTIQ